MIERAATGDLAALRALELACFSPAWSGAALAPLLQNPAYLVLIERAEAGETRAYLIGWQIGEDAELARLGVFPNARGQGIAGSLVDSALSIWRESGVRNVFLEVRQSNQIARRLYTARNFEEIGKRVNYYDDGETALVLKNSLII